MQSGQTAMLAQLIQHAAGISARGVVYAMPPLHVEIGGAMCVFKGRQLPVSM
jgi:hypothetical protein